MADFYIGTMSGTSMDGLDVALVAVGDAYQFELQDFRTYPFEETFRREMLAAMEKPQIEPDRLVALNRWVGEVIAERVQRFLKERGHDPKQIRAVGMHGVTFRHTPEPYAVGGTAYTGTLQLGDPFALQLATGIETIFGFRQADMAVGGQGAPLAPFFDYHHFRRPDKGRILLNLGGIANLTLLPAGASPDAVYAFDSGPANMILDGLMREHPETPHSHDPNGALSARGLVIPELLAQCTAHPYFALQPPKSTGRELFGETFMNYFRAHRGRRPYEDLLATAVELTVSTIASSIRSFQEKSHMGKTFDEIIVAGGGTHNTFMLKRLADYFPAMGIHSLAQHGLDPDAKEAVLIALLCRAFHQRDHGNFLNVTGASRRVVLGCTTG